ncbi:MAG: hypothetical protein MUF79_08470 [Burkholderiales bacterium]|jgi:hypothetical protein|nr:hypothetical protein [Burkholderiales bacterium]
MTQDARPPVLDAEHAAFVQGGVTISVSSRDAGLRASISRGVGCRVSADRRRVTLFVAGTGAQKLLRDIAATKAIAVCFSQPSTHRTIQIKGSDARIAAAEPGDLAIIERQLEARIAELVPLGYAEPVVRAVFHADPGDVVTVAFTPDAAFAQTPGPNAGRRLAA